MSYSLYTQAEIPSAVKLREMLRSIGGIHRVVEDELTRLWISWLLSSSDVFTQGGHSILYIKMLADMELAIKVGLIHPTKIKVQQYAARLGWGLPVYSYFREVEKTVLGSIEKELCPVCGPKWRAAAFWEEPGCWCTTPKSVLVMPLAQDLTSLERSAGGPLDHLLGVGDMPSDVQAAQALQALPQTKDWAVQPEAEWSWPKDLLESGLPDAVLMRLGYTSYPR